jgi:hypothetical protein
MQLMPVTQSGVDSHVMNSEEQLVAMHVLQAPVSPVRSAVHLVGSLMHGSEDPLVPPEPAVPLVPPLPAVPLPPPAPVEPPLPVVPPPPVPLLPHEAELVTT